jgi:hypothetical protein
MVQLNRSDQKIVNRGLQRLANVLLSGPFKKVSQRLTEPVFIPGPEVNFRGRPEAIRQSVRSNQTKSHVLFATEVSFAKNDG